LAEEDIEQPIPGAIYFAESGFRIRNELDPELLEDQFIYHPADPRLEQFQFEYETEEEYEEILANMLPFSLQNFQFFDEDEPEVTNFDREVYIVAKDSLSTGDFWADCNIIGVRESGLVFDPGRPVVTFFHREIEITSKDDDVDQVPEPRMGPDYIDHPYLDYFNRSSSESSPLASPPTVEHYHRKVVISSIGSLALQEDAIVDCGGCQFDVVITPVDFTSYRNSYLEITPHTKRSYVADTDMLVSDDFEVTLGTTSIIPFDVDLHPSSIAPFENELTLVENYIRYPEVPGINSLLIPYGSQTSGVPYTFHANTLVVWYAERTVTMEGHDSLDPLGEYDEYISLWDREITPRDTMTGQLWWWDYSRRAGVTQDPQYIGVHSRRTPYMHRNTVTRQ
jgi:hypothetical protein